jgi:molybdopterin synthase catalytic subunit
MQKHVHEKGTVSIEKLIANIKDMPNFYKVGAIAIFVGLSAAKTIEERRFRSCARAHSPKENTH